MPGNYKTVNNSIYCWQINLHKSKAASYNLQEVTKNLRSGLVLIQEPWTYGELIRGKLRGLKLFQGNRNGQRPRACVYATPDLKCFLLPMFSDADVVAVRVQNLREGDHCIFSSVYMANEEPAPPEKFRELVSFCEAEKIPLIVGSDANAHHTTWGSSNVNDRGEHLLAYCACNNLEICNVGQKPTFRTSVREEVLDLTLANCQAWGLVRGWHVSDVPSFSDHMYIRFAVKGGAERSVKLIRNVRRTCWTRYTEGLERKILELNCAPEITSSRGIDTAAGDIQDAIIKSFEEACPLRRIQRRNDNKWWSAELSQIRKEARRALRRAIKTKATIDWEAHKRTLALFKQAVRKAKRDSWRNFTENMESHAPTARLVKALRDDRSTQVNCVLKPNGGMTSSPEETLNCLLDALAPGSSTVTASSVDPIGSLELIDNENLVANICSDERMQAAISEFLPYKAPGLDGIYPVLLQKGWKYIKKHYQKLFRACLRYGYVPKAWRTGSGIFLPKPGKNSYLEPKSFRMITLTSFQLKWLERLVLFHLNEDLDFQSNLISTQYGFRTGVSTETALHEFVLRVEQNLVKKRVSLGIFLDIVGAFDNVTFDSVSASLRELEVPAWLIRWIDFMIRHRKVQVEMCGATVEREIQKGNPQGGILSPLLWNCVLNPLLKEFQKRCLYAQAYADDLAVLVASANVSQVRSMGQKAVNIAAEWAQKNALQFSSAKTEVVLFTRKRKTALGSLWMNGQRLNLSKEAKLLGVTLDSKLTWKNHITRITTKATAVLMQSRRIVGKTWGVRPLTMKWIYTAMVRPILTYACVSWVSGIEKLYLRNILNKVQRLACLMISSAFPGTPTRALETLLGIMPIDEFIRAEAVRGSYRLDQVGLWPTKTLGTSGKTVSHVDLCSGARKELALLGMPADHRRKTRSFKRNFECLILDRTSAIEYEGGLDESHLKCYTDGSKLSERVGAGLYIKYPYDSRSVKNCFHLGKLSTVFQAEVFGIWKVAEALLVEGTHDQDIIILSDSQAAIKAIEGSMVRSNTVLQCIESLNRLGINNRLMIAWTPGHQGVHGNEEADELARRGSELSVEGPEPFIPVPYATCVMAIKDWSMKRWKAKWESSSDCVRTREHVGWYQNRLTNRLLGLHRNKLNLVLQILTGHCNLQKHKRTTGRSDTPICPKCGVEEETPDHHVGRCVLYQNARVRFLGKRTTTVKAVVEKLNMHKLAAYLRQVGRLAEFDS